MSVKRILVEGKTQEEKNTALMEASEYGNTEIAELLRDAGASAHSPPPFLRGSGAHSPPPFLRGSGAHSPPPFLHGSDK